MRIPHAVPGCADALVPQLMKDGFCSTLILSPPGGGKTTLLRECVRRLSDHGLRISLMDERGEIAAVQNRTPQFDVGANTDIMTGGQKAACCMMLLRAMRPDVLAFDEISAPEDIEAIRALDMLTPDARAALLTLGAQLGKYDAQLQRQALDACIASLQSISAALQDDARRRGKLVCGLGATLGLLAAVALL